MRESNLVHNLKKNNKKISNQIHKNNQIVINHHKYQLHQLNKLHPQLLNHQHLNHLLELQIHQHNLKTAKDKVISKNKVEEMEVDIEITIEVEIIIEEEDIQALVNSLALTHQPLFSKKNLILNHL